MYFRVLGPVEIWDEDRCIPVGASKAQHVLAILLLASGLAVSAVSIADRLWDGVDEGSAALKMLGEIQRVLAQDHPSDRKVAAAYEKLKAKNPKLAKRLDRVDPVMYAAVETAVAVRKLLNQFALIDAEEPRADKQDEQWQALWAKHGKVLVERRDREELRYRQVALARDRLTKWGKVSRGAGRTTFFSRSASGTSRPPTSSPGTLRWSTGWRRFNRCW